MKIEYLHWDSSFFHLKIGEIFCEKFENNEDSCDYDLIYLKQYREEKCKIAGFEKTFEETKVTFSKTFTILSHPTLNFKTIDFDYSPQQNEVFYDLAYISGQHSRFLLDPNFGKENFQKLYRIWVDNSITKKFADKIFYTAEENVVTGFVTLKKEGNAAKIGLIAVHPEFQGKGIGAKLIFDCESYCVANNIQQLLIPTQKENINACNFYLKLGYSVTEKIHIKHFWKINRE